MPRSISQAMFWVRIYTSFFYERKFHVNDISLLLISKTRNNVNWKRHFTCFKILLVFVSIVHEGVTWSKDEFIATPTIRHSFFGGKVGETRRAKKRGEGKKDALPPTFARSRFEKRTPDRRLIAHWYIQKKLNSSVSHIDNNCNNCFVTHIFCSLIALQILVYKIISTKKLQP